MSTEVEYCIGTMLACKRDAVCIVISSSAVLCYPMMVNDMMQALTYQICTASCKHVMNCHEYMYSNCHLISECLLKMAWHSDWWYIWKGCLFTKFKNSKNSFKVNRLRFKIYFWRRVNEEEKYFSILIYKREKLWCMLIILIKIGPNFKRHICVQICIENVHQIFVFVSFWTFFRGCILPKSCIFSILPFFNHLGGVRSKP